MFEVTDIEKSVSQMIGKGVEFYIPEGQKTPIFTRGPTKIATFKDPDGNYLQLIQLPK